MDNNLTTLLKYQELDIKLHKSLDAIEKSDASKKMEQARNEFNAAKKIVQGSEKEAESVVTSVEQTQPQLSELSDKLGELQLIIENAETSDDLKGLAEQLESLKNKAVAIEKKLTESKSNSERLIKSYQDANTRGHKMRDVYNSAKSERDELKNASAPERDTLEKQLSELEKQIDPELFAKYKAVTAENKFPAFVEVLVGDDKICFCRGCGLQLSSKNASTLSEKGLCTCETCRRIIYKAQ